jgi:hypothetical protein
MYAVSPAVKWWQSYPSDPVENGVGLYECYHFVEGHRIGCLRRFATMELTNGPGGHVLLLAILACIECAEDFVCWPGYC